MFSVKEVYGLYVRYNVPRAAGALAYFFVLSVFPLALCVSLLVGMAWEELCEWLHLLDRVLPQPVLRLVEDYVDYVARNRSPALLWAAVPAVVLSASAALRVLLDTMDEACGRPRDTGLGRLVLSGLVSMLFLVTACLAVPAVFAGEWFLARRWVRSALLLAFVFLPVLGLYRLGAPKGAGGWPKLTVGALLCTLALTAASGIFSRVIGMSSRYCLLYGSLASVMVLLLWLYLCGTILLLGAIFSCVWIKKSRHSSL